MNTDSLSHTIQINVTGPCNGDTSTIAYLLADFLSHTGFKIDLHLIDPISDLATFEQNFSKKLEYIEHNETRIIVNEIQAKCDEA